MKRQSQFNSQEQQQGAQQQRQQSAPLEFGSVEELLRHDALHTPVPPSIGRRLQESLLDMSAPRRRWWRRLFGGL
ncbi:MAG: hypothetical protein ABSF95_05655 [Verrucomicrobiota bacterium]|jgi:hypothetical protein